MSRCHLLITLCAASVLLGVRGVGWGAPPDASNAPWPFTVLEAPPVPQVQNASWVRNPIDAFVLAKLDAKNIQPAPEVPPRVWLRRLYFDLVGLPPTPADVNRFLNSSSSDRERHEIDRLLHDSRYGERWGRHWLDLVRYADTGGGGLDFPLPHMWRYRDYVIRAFNQDRPYDRFIREQIAGDAYEAYGDEGRIGAGFLRLGVFLEGTREEMRRELLNDLVSTTGSVFLGLTMGCARCHDHKFDPIPTRDYYRLEAFFAAVTVRPEPIPFTQYERPAELERRATVWGEGQKRRQTERDEVIGRFRERLVPALTESLNGPQDLKDIAVPLGNDDLAVEMERGLLFTKPEVEQYRRLNRQTNGSDNLPDLYKPIAYTATELVGASNEPEPNYPVPPTTFVLEGGDPKQKSEAVEPGYLAVATGSSPPVDLDGVQFSRRKFLAEWLSSPDNPLTARVMVNRIWHYHFGEGLVATPSDFGINGAGTVHQDLIDWLAVQFIESGWSVKEMHRLILQSNVYRQSLSNPRSEEYSKLDPGNALLWQRRPIRLESETIRDSILAVSGHLNPAAGGPGFFPELDDALLLRASTWWDPSPSEERNRRSVYMLQKRAVVHPMLSVFDGTNLNESCSVRGITTVTPQVFALLNGKFVHENAQALADRATKENATTSGGDGTGANTDPAAQVVRAYELALQRPPTRLELLKSVEFLRQRTLAELCLVLLNLNEFVYLE